MGRMSRRTSLPLLPLLLLLLGGSGARAQVCSSFPCPGSADGTGTNAAFRNPYGITGDGAGFCEWGALPQVDKAAEALCL